MAYEILSVKLCELEDQFSRLSSRIHLSEMADGPQLRQQIRALRQECAESELSLQTKMRCSRAELVRALADSYEEVEKSIQKARIMLQENTERRGTPEAEAEEKILLAEYALDFAMQAANRALLLSLEAIDAQLAEQEGDGKSL